MSASRHPASDGAFDLADLCRRFQGWRSSRCAFPFAEEMPQIANEGNGFLAVAGINLNSSFYQIMLFWIFTIGLGIVFRMISGSIGIFAKLPVVSSVNRVLGGLASFLMMYAVIFFALLFAASWPNARVRNSIDDSTIARFILNKTPGLSERIISDWLPIKDV